MYTFTFSEDIDLSQFMTSDDQSTANDLLLAQMMQHEFDREHDKEIKIKENKFNSQSKGLSPYFKHSNDFISTVTIKRYVFKKL